MSWDQAGDPGIVGDPDLLPDRHEAGALIKSERLGMIQGAGMQPYPGGTQLPGGGYRAREQILPPPSSDEIRQQSEVCNLH